MKLMSHLPINYAFLLARIVFYCVVFGQRCPAFELQGKVAKETLRNATVRLMRQRDVVDFAVEWIEKNRR